MKRRLLILAALAAVLAPPATARADDTTLGFDTIRQGTALSDQFLDRGVLFGSAAQFGFGAQDGCTPATPLVVAAPPGGLGSPPNVFRLGRCGGQPEFPRFGSMGAFSSGRSKVSMLVKDFFGGGTSDHVVELRVYGVRRNLLRRAQVRLLGTPQRLTIELSQPLITFFVIEVSGTQVNAAIDDFSFDNPPVPPDPQIAVAVEAAGGDARLRQGGTTRVAVRVLRFNGSNGPVALSAEGLPAGVESATFTPNPAGGSAFVTTSVLTLAASATARTGTSTARLRAVPAGGSGTEPDVTSLRLAIVEPFRLGGAGEARVAPCSPTSVPISLEVEPDMTEPISLTVRSSRPSVVGSLPATYVRGFSAPLRALAISAPEGAGTGDATLTVRATSGGFVDEHVVNVDRHPGAIDSIRLAAIADVYPTTVRAPQPGVAATRLRIGGSGLCPGSTIRFGAGDDAGAALEDRAADGRSALVTVPVTATSGRLALTNSDSTPSVGLPAQSQRTLTVESYRNTRGFSFANFRSSDLAWEDLVRLHGRSETHVEVDVCSALTLGLASCSLGPTFIPKPSALIYLNSVRDIGEKGNCFGLALASARLASARTPLSRFLPPGAASVWALTGPPGPGGDLRDYVRIMQAAQSSREALQLRADSVGRQNPTTLRQAIEGMLAAGRPAMVSLKTDNGGHAVLAYALTATGTGYAIEVYDPNHPFLASEDASGPQHAVRLARSRILVQARDARWAFAGLNWSGGFDRIGAYDPARIPDVPAIPDEAEDLLTLISNPDALAVRDLSGEGVVSLPSEAGEGSAPVVHLAGRGRPLRATLSGRGLLAAFAGGRALTLDGSARALTLDRGTRTLRAEGAAAGLRLSTTATVRGGTRAVTAQFTDRGDVALGLDAAGAVTVRASRSGSVRLTFGETSRAAASSLQLAPLRLRAGEITTVRPGSWRHPDRAAVTTRSGARRLLAARTTRAAVAVRGLSLRAVQARRGRVAVQARMNLKLAHAVAAGGALAWQAMRGRRVVRTGSVPLAAEQLRRRSPVRIDLRLPRGSYRLQAALVIGGTPRSGVVASVARRQASIRVRVR